MAMLSYSRQVKAGMHCKLARWLAYCLLGSLSVLALAPGTALQSELRHGSRAQRHPAERSVADAG